MKTYVVTYEVECSACDHAHRERKRFNAENFDAALAELWHLTQDWFPDQKYRLVGIQERKRTDYSLEPEL